MGDIVERCFNHVFGTFGLKLPEYLFSDNGLRNCSCCDGTPEEMYKRGCYNKENIVIFEPITYKK